ncbi:hypothetical protein MT325_M618L [Paramecium bursaria chlorella virus MT325]|jgi:hypothetical protein|uniref:Uncharacterized protein M618L n=1 Tax=Paramecium bursaria Chlorella virus MT325 TaxID=346932 RepID=A7IUZ8_PBCVM|nr:hypothetical protein MT325_M618L [Paramecium bursaria chlorella virus MT325]AGE49939.1 hypothetical protein PBCVCan184_751L [Paramecium bursaria Chlorella virus Can18-4]AGE58107.1 hypothetical protein PBCVNW6652_715L [Paramecium bursaria Chlorella virus NW665.2]
MLDNPYTASTIIALLAATLFTLYTKFSNKEEKNLYGKFAQVFVSALVAGIAFTFVTSSPDETLNLPFEQGGLADF